MNDTITYLPIMTDTLNHETMMDSLQMKNPYKDFRFVTEHPREYKGPVLREVTFVSAGWNFMILFIAMILVVLNKFFAPNRFASMISMSFQNGGGEKLIRENQSFFSLVSLSIIASFILLLSMFVQKIFLVYGGNIILHDNLNFFLNVAMTVTTLLIFNYLLTVAYSWLFKSDALIVIHVNLCVSSMAMGVLLLIPVMMVMLFYPYKFIALSTLIILLLIYLVRLAKLLIETRMLSKLNFVNIFLYLCTIEILPILMIVKMILMVV